MAEEWLRSTTRPVKMAQVDTTAPNVARVWNYLIGGRDNFEVDRKAARQLIAASPVIAVVGPVTRAFHGRVVRFLAEAGIRQFLDIGTGLPTAGNTHEIAQDVAPECRIVYVDNDPIVLAHARALLTSRPEGATSYVQADAREPEKIIEEARLTLDLSQPVAVILIDILNFIPDAVMVAEVMRALREAVVPGSYFAVMQPASDLDPTVAAAALRWNQMAATPVALRTRAEVAAWADGLELLEPGVVQVPLWRPEERRPDERRPQERGPEEGPSMDAELPSVLPLYGFVARKG